MYLIETLTVAGDSMDSFLS